MSADILTDTPSAWVGCLSCYNSGRLFGKWLDGNACDDLAAAGLATFENVAGYLAYRCVKCFGDEFSVMDHQNFHGLITGECSTSEAVKAADILEELEEDKREAFGAWVSNGSGDIESGSQFEEAYCGEWDNFRAYSDQYVEDTGMLTVHNKYYGHDQIDDVSAIIRYFDYDAFSRDLEHDYWTHDTGRGSVLVFNANS